jgi:hypothetical protein
LERILRFEIGAHIEGDLSPTTVSDLLWLVFVMAGGSKVSLSIHYLDFIGRI